MSNGASVVTSFIMGHVWSGGTGVTVTKVAQISAKVIANPIQVAINGSHKVRNLSGMTYQPKNLAQGIKMEIELVAISPVAYMLAKVGDLAEIKALKPHANEYRANIGARLESLVVFKGATKIGVISAAILAKHGREAFGKRCRIEKMSKEDNVIVIRLMQKSSK